MADDQINPQNHPGEQNLPDEADLLGEVPVEDDAADQPRRAASAQFVVETEVGAEAAMREAMDPANQSLAEALRLSFRVLQIVIVVLLGLFFASGFQTVGEGQSGVQTRWGRIVEDKGALEPGLHFSGLPYPAGQFHIVDVDNRTVSLRQDFWPATGGLSLDEATERATIHARLEPGNDGYVVTRGGDMAHLRLGGQYQIDNPVAFLERVPEAMADHLVRLSLQRAAVHTGAQMSLQELVDRPVELRAAMQERAQAALDQSGAGVRLSSVNISQVEPPLAIRRVFGDVQQARVEVERRVEQARQDANQVVIDAAGANYRRIIRLINRYEDSLRAGEEERAERLLAEINAQLDSDELSGEVAAIIQQARAYRSQIDASLGGEARRFLSILSAFREHPELVVRQRWLTAYANVLSRRDVEVYFVPRRLGTVALELASPHEVKEIRQQMRLDRMEQEHMMEFRPSQPYLWRGRDMRLDGGPGRQLRLEDGRPTPLGDRR